MTVIETFKSEFRFSAQGRTSRSNFWIYTLGTWAITIVCTLVAGLIYGITNSENLFMILMIVVGLGLVVLNIAYAFVTMRRLHDMGYSGWWFLAVVGALMLSSVFQKAAPGLSLAITFIVYVCLSMRSDVHPNRFD